jgi:hypothetical protein
VRLYNLHLPTPRSGLQAVRTEKWGGLQELEHVTEKRRQISALTAAAVKQSKFAHVAAGDLNMPVESTIFRRDWSELTNAFVAAGWGLGATFRTRWHGIRIDHVLADEHWFVARCWVGPDVGSAHMPLIADLVWLESEEEAEPRYGAADETKPANQGGDAGADDSAKPAHARQATQAVPPGRPGGE